MSLETELRAAGVIRWHIVETTRPQNLAEHQFNVALIARRLAILSGMTRQEQDTLVAKALVHDQHEIADGDVPSTAKPERGLELDSTMRIIQVADKIEAYWFIKNRHVDRPDVVHDTRARLSRLMDEASPDFAAIVTRVMAEMGAI
tara:strand:+ start:27236 stop:27673 length:438 start_codon:yes stop_codon:yes gene_type:complete